MTTPTSTPPTQFAAARPASRSLAERFRAMPRVIQWVAYAAIGGVLALVWLDYIAPIGDEWEKQANRIQDRVDQIRSIHRSAANLRDIENVAKSIGPVDTPAYAASGAASFNTIVNTLLKKHGAANQSFSVRTKGNLPRNSLTSIAKGKRIERLTGDLKFDATPSAAAAIIAELEASPDIEAVDSIRMTRDAQGKVKVHLTIEAWVLSSEGKPAATGASL